MGLDEDDNLRISQVALRIAGFLLGLYVASSLAIAGWMFLFTLQVRDEVKVSEETIKIVNDRINFLSARLSLVESDIKEVYRKRD